MASLTANIKNLVSKITGAENKPITAAPMEGKEAVGFLDARLKQLSDQDTKRRWRYDLLTAFYNGRQWSDSFYGNEAVMTTMTDYGMKVPSARPQGSNQVTFNKVGPVVDKYVEFLSVAQLQPHVPKQSLLLTEELSPLERAQKSEPEQKASVQADVTEKLGRSVMFTDNDARAVFARVAEQSARIGDGWYRSVTHPQKKKVVMEALDAYNITAWWKDNTFNELAGVIYTGEMDFDTIRRSPEEGGLNVDGKLDGLTMDQANQFRDARSGRKSGENMVLYYNMAIDIPTIDSEGNTKYRHRDFIIVGDIVVQDVIKPEAIPYYQVCFKKRTNEGWGESPVWWAINLQIQLNVALSDEADVVGWFGSPWIIDENSGQKPQDIIGGTDGPKIVPINEGGRIYFLEWSGRIYPIGEHINRILKAFDDVTGMPAIAYGAIDASLATGVALTTSFQPTIQKIKRWTEEWNTTLRRMWKDNLVRLMVLNKEYRDFIQDNFQVEWEWGERAPRDESLYATTVINQKNAKLLSDETAMTKLGVPSPLDEKIRIAHEINNSFYNPELAIQKLNAYMQYEQIKQQAIQAQMAAQAPQKDAGAPTGSGEPVGMPGAQGGPRTAAGSAAPNLTPNLQNVPQPMAQPGQGGNSYQQPVPGSKR